MIFNKYSFMTKKEESIKVDDFIEMTNHFRTFDYIFPISKNYLLI